MKHSSVETLIAAIVTWADEKESFVTKTKLLKLLYLFDLEYHRRHGKTFTSFQWKFYLLGPWAAEYDSTLERLMTSGFLSGRTSHGSETMIYKVDERVEPNMVFDHLADELILRDVLKKWAFRTTGEILDHVYFQTEPMDGAIRNQPLNFNTVLSESPGIYRRTSSGVSPADIKRRRTEFETRMKERSQHGRAPDMIPPRYDEEFIEAMGKLDSLSA